ncbi:peptidoglycan DD-metalloendopeptidase family protein [Antarcticibacterium arcticum]|uniref:Peptidoglycan DD-metalloendopeptidase family protein n=1 Tax=Antarcticibacterium arcticum TaxID=2585771 RepID=A0A5B8YLW6_9FLAO|nr:peptidoglycan DD-metalloendopeptidase family protein [Antarcticibacterium arcticum]QED37797.1 peptidoglycan DD-metalloendopeptidase family protein [Antarcticibacterium arcticum]
MAKDEFAEFIKELTTGFTPVIDTKYAKKDFVHIDLSGKNKDLNNIKIPSALEYKKYIDEFVASQKAKVAFGGYNEKRNLYQQSVIFNNENKSSPREVHIGLDLWCDVGTSVIAPLDGTVHSFQDNEGFGNYGPTLILEHIYGEKTFYTLYGHLSRKCLETFAFGQIIEAGDKLGKLGSSRVNGDYAPHLHFQIINDLQGFNGDYPGVVAAKDLDTYLKNCPDPNLLLKI